MELLDRYLQAVRKRLPWNRQDDIVAELKVNLESQLEEKEAALGRPLTPLEAESWLRQLGSPAQMAARYMPQRYLIGPKLFPTYVYALKVVFFWALVTYSVVCAVQLATGVLANASDVALALLRAPVIVMNLAAWVTLAFAIVEFAKRSSTARKLGMVPPTPDWQPATLPPLEMELATGKKRRSYAHAVAEVVFGFLFLIWFLLVPEFPYLMFGPGAWYLSASPYQLAAVWMVAYWWLVGLNAMGLIWNIVQLMRGEWQNQGLTHHVVFKTAGLVPVLVLAMARERVLVVLRHPAIDQMRYGGSLDAINQGLHKALMILTALIVLQLLWDLGVKGLELLRSGQTPSVGPRSKNVRG